jgi:kexin
LNINPEDPDWEKTAAGRPYSYKYGYGRLDAWQFVTAAKTWHLVKPQAWVEMPLSELGGGMVDSSAAMLGGLPIVPGGVGSTMSVSHDLLLEHNFEKLEHVTVTVWINHTTRGNVEVELRSPNGIRSVLAGPRQYDTASTGYPGWTFMTIKHWSVALVSPGFSVP